MLGMPPRIVRRMDSTLRTRRGRASAAGQPVAGVSAAPGGRLPAGQGQASRAAKRRGRSSLAGDLGHGGHDERLGAGAPVGVCGCGWVGG